MGNTTPLIGLPNFDKFEILREGTSTAATAAPTTVGAGWASEFQIAYFQHNLGFKPLVVAAMDFSTSFYMLPYSASKANFGVNNFYDASINVFASSTYVYFVTSVTTNTSATGGVSFGGFPLRFWLMRKAAG